MPSLLTSGYLAYDDLARTPTVGSIFKYAGVTTAVVGTQTGIGLVDGEFGFGETIDFGRDEYHKEATAETSATEQLGQTVSSVAVSASDWLRTVGANRVNKRLRGVYRTFFGGMGSDTSATRALEK